MYRHCKRENIVTNMARGRRWGGVATFREMSSRVPLGFLFSCIMKVYEVKVV